MFHATYALYLPFRWLAVGLLGMALLVLLYEWQHRVGRQRFVHDNLTVGVEEYHGRRAMNVVGLLVVDVDIGTANIDKGQLVLFHIVYPFACVALVAHSVDLEYFVARGV